MSQSDDEGSDIMGDMFPEPPRPATPPPTHHTYRFPSYSPFSEQELIICLVGGRQSLWAHVLFNSSIAMSDYLSRPENTARLVKGKHVIEFGAGGGLPCLAAAVLGARTAVITDYPDKNLLDNLEENVEQNKEAWPVLAKSAVVEGHIWGKDPESVRQVLKDRSDGQSSSPPADTFQLALLSDLIFNHSQHSALLDSLETLLDPSDGVALVFHSHHLPQWRERDLNFFTLAKERGWVVEQVLEEVRGVQFAEDGGDVSLRERVWGWEMRRQGGSTPKAE